ncbi:MAG TPA: HYR domain-containing protein [Verrucomicrobiae bacterium]|nr:HYR domain-containing protein [Verrucomicrobiae bacterium]
MGITPVTCTANTALCGIQTCSFTITVNDIFPPLLVCPPNQTANASPGRCDAVVSYPAPTATDNCPKTTVSCTPPSGSTFPVGVSTVTCTATDSSGNKSTCSFTVTVKDNQPPQLVCPPNQNVNCTPAQCAAVVSYTTPSASDNCPGATVVCVPPSGSAFPVGTTTVRCTATDKSLNTTACSFTITVRDNLPPVLSCPPNLTLPAGKDSCGAIANFSIPVATDNCPDVTVTCVPPPGSFCGIGTKPVICIAKDLAGNADTCSFTVTVIDTLPPVIVCPPNQTVNASGNCAAVVTYPPPTVIENCPPATVSCSPPSGSTFQAGTTTVVCIAADNGGRKDTCSFTVTVKDTQPPTIACPPNQTANAGPGCEAIVSYPAPTVSDNCPNPTVSCNPPSGSSFPIGTKTVVCIATDKSGNKDTCSFTVTVRDNQPPTVVCPPNIILSAGKDSCGAIAIYTTPVAVDNCPGASVLCVPPSGTFCGIGAKPVVCIATDASGNKDTCSFTITVKDLLPPVLVCPPNQTANASQGQCAAVVSYPPPTVIENCPPASVNCTPPSGSSFPVGNSTVVCIATDNAGNKDTCSFTVIVKDNQSPIVSCPPNQTTNAGGGQCAATVQYPLATLSDNCPGGTVSCVPPSGSSFPVGTTTVVCIGTDVSGNKDTCSFTVTVRDNQPPSIACPPNQTVGAGANCEAVVSYPSPTVSDNCPGATVNCAPSSGSTFQVGTSTVVCIATDKAGNKDTCSFTVTVRDNQPPQIACPPNQTANANGQCVAVVSYPPPTASDNCPGSVTVNCTPPSGSSFPVGNTTVLCIAADASGNKDTCSFTITVRDNQPPSIVCPPNQTVNAGANCVAVVTYPGPTVSDNCPDVTFNCIPPSGSPFPVGTNTVVCIAVDKSGNKDTCSFTVTVRDNQPPTVICPPNLTLVAIKDSCGAILTYTIPGAIDNCPGSTVVTCVPPPGTFCGIGTKPVICIAKDLAGNADTCSFTVTVKDIVPPVVICPPNQAVNANGQCAAVVTYPPPTVIENCPPATVSCTPPSGSTFQVGISTVVCIATDNAGNKDTCSFTVTVRDNQPPQIVCPPNQTVSAEANCLTVVTYPPPTVSDNCPEVMFNCVPASGSTFPTGTTTVVCIAVDKSGNKDTCSFTVTVNDNQPPQIVCPPNIVLPAIKDSCGAIAVYTPPVAVDNCPASVEVDCIPPPGSFCGIGITTVKCIAKDKSGNADTCQFTITVQDLLPPVVVCPSGVTLQVGSDCGAIAIYTPPVAIDNCGPVTVECTPPSGSFCGVGVTVVTCTATDKHGNKTTCGFNITVEDVTPPVVVCPSGITVHTSNSAGAICVYTPPVATDNCPPATVECSPPSGTFCGIGITLVTCTATDKHGNKSTCGFAITVVLNGGAPPSPVIDSVTPNAGKVDVCWSAVPDKDLKEYRVYRDTTDNFGTSKLIGHTAATQYKDSTPNVGKRLYYRLTAVDSAGNESQPSEAASTFFGKKGDLNFDGQLTPMDLVILMDCLHNGTGDCSLEIGDVNCDGELFPSDLILLLRAVFDGESLPC